MSETELAPGSINLHELPLPQLQAVKQQLEEEIQVLTTSFSKLKQAQVKFYDAIDSAKKLKSGSEVLVPLTNSLYVSGTIDHEDKVIVDVGTGYYIEKTVKEAQDYYQRKVEYIKGNLLKLEETVNQRQSQRKVLLQVLQEKMAEAAKVSATKSD
ncbi:Prefoldin [Globomyces pollinis-pini]|nr:Prefoldin [Globomyces pollinis-pini]